MDREVSKNTLTEIYRYTPKKEYTCIYGWAPHFLYGSCIVTGWKRCQHDRLSCVANFHQDKSLFALFDGHGGDKISEYLHNNYADYLKDCLTLNENDPETALYLSFLTCDFNFQNFTEKEFAPIKEDACKNFKNAVRAELEKSFGGECSKEVLPKLFLEMQFKLLPFVGCKISFIGYQTDEEEHMTQVATKNGGETVRATDLSCTHIVVEDGQTVNTHDYNSNVFIVKNEWFWACIQMEAKAEERIYKYENPCLTSSSSSHIIPVRGNKHKRLESVAHQLAMEGIQEIDYFAVTQSSEQKKKMDVAKLSISGSFLDATLSSDKTLDNSGILDEAMILRSPPPIDMQMLPARQQVCVELFQTESNYVGILNTIITVFKQPLEHPEQVGGPLLAPAEIKIIFGNVPPIFEIHQKIRNELASIIHTWSDDHSIGNLILSHSQEFMKAYPPFVNFFEKTKEVLANCDAAKPRFHAFLKRCQSRPECGRQTLQELLIRPIQRLPSVILLLSDILKNTNKNNADHAALEKAIQALKDVMMHINEDKRKTEGQVAMFDIVNDIENCPVNVCWGSTASVLLLSKERAYVANVGDCRCVASLNGIAVDMSKDHHPFDEEELARIRESGYSVVDDRIEGLHVSRAFGHFGLKKSITQAPEDPVLCHPHISFMDIKKDLEFIILASGAVWNGLSSQDVVNFILDRKEEDPADICSELFEVLIPPELSENTSGCENMSAIIIFFEDTDATSFVEKTYTFSYSNYRIEELPKEHDIYTKWQQELCAKDDSDPENCI